MIRAFVLVAGLVTMCHQAHAEEFVSSAIMLHFVGPNGAAQTVELHAGVPKSVVGTDKCADSLGDMFEAFENEARKQLANNTMTLDSVECSALGDNWVTITTRPNLTEINSTAGKQ